MNGAFKPEIPMEKFSRCMIGFGSPQAASKWLAVLVIIFVSVVLLSRFKLQEETLLRSSIDLFTNRSWNGRLNVHAEEATSPIEPQEKIERSNNSLFFSLPENSSTSESLRVSVWPYLEPVFRRADLFPEAKQGLKEAEIAWHELIGEQRWEALNQRNRSANETDEKRCPYSVSSVDSTELGNGDSLLQIPCGLILDSSITLVGVSRGVEGDFAIELSGAKLPGESAPPIILHYNVRLQGDQVTENAVIVQNTWTTGQGWAEEDRCPKPKRDDAQRVDGLDVCIDHIGKVEERKLPEGKGSTISKRLSVLSTDDKKPWFPFINGFPFAATMWVGLEGFHMTVNGKHITSFEYRQNLEPSAVTSVRWKGNLKPISVMANGLPTSHDVTGVIDLEFLKAPTFTRNQNSELFIGVFSTSNNFDNRMAVRRSWMQYEAVRSGQATVRFFVGLHSNKQVNKELWKEAETYGDIQLLPFVDYYNLITLKTIAICIFGTKMINAKYIMKTDDDTFVRVDEVLTVLNKTQHIKGLLCGSIEFDAKPHRDQKSKWYVSNEEWPHALYPPWAHGPGYVVSRDIAKFVVKSHKERSLKLFKLEDVSMGIWIQEYKNHGGKVHYDHNERFFNTGCSAGYVIAHYQNPKHMLCLWQKLKMGSGPICCD